MTIEEQIMKLQTYKMYEGEDTVYVERDDILKLLEQQPKMQDCEHCIHTYGTLGCCDMVNNEWVYDCEFGKEQYKKEHESQPCEDCIRELIREFDNKHPALFADYMQEFNNHPISEIIEYMWDMHNLIEDIKYRLPDEEGDEE